MDTAPNIDIFLSHDLWHKKKSTRKTLSLPAACTQRPVYKNKLNLCSGGKRQNEFAPEWWEQTKLNTSCQI